MKYYFVHITYGAVFSLRIDLYNILFFRFCGGLILDIKRKAPFFFSDFYDALHIQSLSAILFIYLGTVTNAITFGGLLGDATENMQVKIILHSVHVCHVCAICSLCLKIPK